MTWTMTPINFEDEFAYMAYYIDNYLDSIYSSFEFIAIRPVISLKSTVELSTELPDGCTKLDGTEACPYIIKTN